MSPPSGWLAHVYSHLQRLSKRPHFHRELSLSVGVIILVLLGYYFWYVRHYVSTDNAYVNANVIQIAPQITGKVIKLYVENNQHVSANQPLFDIDPAPFIIAVAEAKAQLAKNQADLKLAQLTAQRTHNLLLKNAASQQEEDTANARLLVAEASVNLSQANLDHAELNLTYTQVRAPTSGWISNLSLRNGAIVSENDALFALISDHEFWVDANFKETQLIGIKPGLTADIEVDMYPGIHYQGEVVSLSGGSGTVFALLPPQNATGNWVKVTQRVPVRVEVINPDPQYPLRIGTSTEVTVRLQ